MALQLSKTLANGISGNYWRIDGIELSPHTESGVIKISLFLNSENAARDYIFSDTVVLDQAAYGGLVTSNNVLTYAYNLVKADPRWSGALDV